MMSRSLLLISVVIAAIAIAGKRNAPETAITDLPQNVSVLHLEPSFWAEGTSGINTPGASPTDTCLSPSNDWVVATDCRGYIYRELPVGADGVVNFEMEAKMTVEVLYDKYSGTFSVRRP